MPLDLLRQFALFAALAATPVVATAQGAISGTVVSGVSGLALTGVAVRLDSTGREVLTDRAGRFVFPAVAAGSHTLRTRYLGYAPAASPVEVRSGATTTVTVTLRAAETTLGAVLVVGRAGQAAALAQQQNAANLVNVVAADQIGRFPDANIGDALKRIPGITIGLDQGEARFGSIRGTEPRFNSVMVNGERVPSAEAEVREVQLDLIPADMVQAVEVNKSLTAEMDADAIGGSVNIVTRAAPATPRFSTTIGTGHNAVRQKPLYIGSLVAGRRFLGDRLGAIVSASYYDQVYGSDNKEGVWNKSATGQAYLQQFDVRRYDVQRRRRSVSGSFDWRFNETNTVMFRSIYNSRDDWENRFRTRLVLTAPDTAGLQRAEVRRQTKGGGDSPRIRNARLEDQRTQSHQLSGEHLLGRLGVTWSASIARASETRPDERYIEWRKTNVTFRPDYADTENPTFTATNAALVAPTAFTFRRIELLESYTKDEDRNGRVDVTLPLGDLANETRLKAGFRLREKSKLRDNSFVRAVPRTPPDFAYLSLRGSSDFTLDPNYAGPYEYGTFSTPGYLGSLRVRDTAQFTIQDQPAEYGAANFDATERIGAGYLQYEGRMGALRYIAGVRYEGTQVEYSGFEYDEDANSVTATAPVSTSYGDVLPSVNVRWDLDATTVVRAAWTNSIARPDYYDLVPYRSVVPSDSILETGNPNLAPTRAMNLDLSIERYLPTVGLVSAGLFHKRIRDFVYSFTRFNAVDATTGQTYLQITQPQNGPSAVLTGVEFAYQRQLDFLPGRLRNLGLYTNYTFNDSRVTGLGIASREDEVLPLLGTSKHSGNLSLSYDTPKATVRVAVNFQSEAMDATEGGYNEEAFYDRWATDRTDVDVNASFLVAPQARFFLEANNLTNRPLRFYQGDPSRIMQDEYYGFRLQTGFKFDF